MYGTKKFKFCVNLYHKGKWARETRGTNRPANIKRMNDHMQGYSSCDRRR